MTASVLRTRMNLGVPGSPYATVVPSGYQTAKGTPRHVPPSQSVHIQSTSVAPRKRRTSTVATPRSLPALTRENPLTTLAATTSTRSTLGILDNS